MKILYIAAPPRSGSTILDIAIGSKEGIFSLGEVQRLIAYGVKSNGYCSCNKRVTHCKLWGKVLDKFEEESSLGVDGYNKMVLRYLTNKNGVRLIVNLFSPSPNFIKFKADTLKLYQIINSYTKVDVYVDSSKNPWRLLLLRCIGFKLNVILLKRDLLKYISSVRKPLSKKPDLGIEKTIKPLSYRLIIQYLFSGYVLNFLFSLGLKRFFISHDKFRLNPAKELHRLSCGDHDFNELLSKRGPLDRGHLCAGNRVRLKQSLFIKSK